MSTLIILFEQRFSRVFIDMHLSCMCNNCCDWTRLNIKYDKDLT